MRQIFRASALVPHGFVVEETSDNGAELLIAVRPVTKTSTCPGCRRASGRVHSRYRRSLADLPVAGRRVRLIAHVRRFYCDTVLCGRRIFAERFDDDVLAPRGEWNRVGGSWRRRLL